MLFDCWRRSPHSLCFLALALVVPLLTTSSVHASEPISGVGTMRGKVTFADSGDPVPNVLVSAKEESGFAGPISARTDSDGNYELSLSGFRDTWYVYLEDAGSGSLVLGQLYPDIQCIEPGRDCDLADGGVVAVPGGTVIEGIDFEVEVGGELSGRYDEISTGYPAGSPVLALRVLDAAGQQLFWPLLTFSVMPDGSRYFYTPPLPPGEYYLGTQMRGFFDQLYPGVDCPELNCDFSLGSPVEVIAGRSTTGVDFLVEINPEDGGVIVGSAVPAVEDPFFMARVTAYYWYFGYTGAAGSFGTNGPYLIAGVNRSPIWIVGDAPGYIGELHNSLTCDESLSGNPNGGPCLMPSEYLRSIDAGSVITGIDFVLQRSPIFLDSFDFGGTSFWTTTVTP